MTMRSEKVVLKANLMQYRKQTRLVIFEQIKV